MLTYTLQYSFQTLQDKGNLSSRTEKHLIQNWQRVVLKPAVRGSPVLTPQASTAPNFAAKRSLKALHSVQAFCKRTAGDRPLRAEGFIPHNWNEQAVISVTRKYPRN
jgi:hypothetical protein